MTRWWQDAVGYEVYVRSFADSDGDGVGDLPGVRSRLPYLARLGVDIVWLTPFYPSPQADHGYDVADYLGVDPQLGSVADVAGLVAEAHDLGLRVIIDLVPNHTSDQHEWFVDSRRSREAAHRDWYVWRDPGPDGGPPNNWLSAFGGPAWTLDELTGQYYMHLFLPEQPDLNWANDAVRDAFDDILETWFGRGVDGLRIDVAHSLVEDPLFRDNPLGGAEPPPDAAPHVRFDAYRHDYDLDQEDVLDIYRRWQRVANRYDALLLGEVYLFDAARVARYVTGGDGLHRAFYFPTLRTGWDAEALRSVLREGVAEGGHGIAWPLSSHDAPHAATRFGGGDLGARRSLAYFTLLCGLPGLPFLYQGDELGLDDGVTEVAADPVAVRNPGAPGRDGARTPMVWEPGPGYGFTTGEPWLPFGTNRAGTNTAAAQDGDSHAPLERTRELLRARRRLPALRQGATTWLTETGPILAVDRGGSVVVALHVADPTADTASLELAGAAQLAYATHSDVEVVGTTLRLPPDTAAIVEVLGDAAP